MSKDYRLNQKKTLVAKSGILIGGISGGIVVLIAFALIFVPISEIEKPEIIFTNGHDVSTVGDNSSPIKERELTLVQIFEQSEDSVVRVNIDRLESEELTSNGLGSGFVYDAQGYIITNHHVIDDAEKIVVSFPDEHSYNAELVGTDPYTDIAVLKIDAGAYPLHPLSLGDSSKLKVGEQIAAIGNPFGLTGSMTSGIISQIGRVLPSQASDFSIPDVIQTDAAINPGNSGGPLINMKGEVVGINTAIQSFTGEFAGVGFAIPSDTAKKIVPILIENGKYNHPWIGIIGRDIDPDFAEILGLDEARGVFIESVVEESPAGIAGLLGPTGTIEVDGREYSTGGDIILKVDDKEIRKIHEILIHLQREKAVGDQLELEILRNGNMTTITIILEERPN